MWLPHPDLSWTPATIVSNNGSYTKYRTHQSQELTIANNVTDPHTLELVSPLSREGRVPNLVDLDEMGEGAVIHALRTRYEADDIYTNIGSILVSINPYKLLPIYSTSTIAKYPPSSSSHLSPPHVFQIASTAYHQLMTQREDQAVIISGESGAGQSLAHCSTTARIQCLLVVHCSSSQVVITHSRCACCVLCINRQDGGHQDSAVVSE